MHLLLPILFACTAPAPDTGTAAALQLSWELPLQDAVLRAGEAVDLRAQVSGPAGLVISVGSDRDGEVARLEPDADGLVQASLVGLSPGAQRLTLDLQAPSGATLQASRALVLDQPPLAPSLALWPEAPTAATGLSVEVGPGDDPDGPEPAVQVRWTVDGVETEAPDTGSPGTATPGTVQRGQRWQVRAWAEDALGPGPEAAAEVVIGNAPPVVTDVAVGPAGARAGDTLECAWAYADVDGDADASEASWTVDGEPAGAGPTLEGGFVGGQVATCTVTPHDGWDAGSAASAELEIANTPPVLASVDLGPADGTDAPVTEQTVLSCTPGPVTDADGDRALSTRVTWTVDGVAIAAVGSTLDGAWFDEGQLVGCALTPSDGHEDGESVSAEPVLVVNSPPTAPSVGIAPERPVEGIDGLQCSVSAPALDLDGDPLATSLSWTVDGEPWTGPAEVPAEALVSGQVWTCTAVAADEEGPGPAGSAAVTVRPDQPQQVAPGTNMSCLLEARGTLDCWGWDRRGVASLAPEDEGFVSFDLGSWNGCALDEAGAITCWGGDEACVEGAPTTDGWARVEVGYDVCCALDGSGALSCWGDDTWDLVDDAPGGDGWRDLSLGSENACLLDDLGRVQCWGSDSDGIVSDAPAGEGYVDVAMGYQVACALDSEGFVTCWGEDYEGAVSDAPVTRGHRALSAGERFACALDEDGAATCWGRNDHDQVDGAPDTDGWTDLDSWGHHSCVMDDAGDFECWARNDYGQSTQPPEVGFVDLAAGYSTVCGLGAEGGVSCWGYTGAELDPPDEGEAARVSLHGGLYHFCALDALGGIECWGWDEAGQVGDAPEDQGYRSVGLGYQHSCAVDALGRVGCWGDDTSGVLSLAPDGEGYVAVAAGFAHACALDALGAPTCWGGPEGGEVVAPEVDGLVQVVSNWTHACGLDGDGLATCWGSDSAGQVGDVPTDTPYAAILTPADATCALDAAGLLSCWGSDDIDYAGGAPAWALAQVVSGHDLLCARTDEGGWGCWGTVYVDRW